MTFNPGLLDLTVYQGATFSQILTWKDETDTLVNLTGYTARLMARADIEDAEPFLTLTTENGGISLGGSAGTITLNVSAEDTADLSAQEGVYDLEVVSGIGVVIRLLQGNFIVSREVTR